MSFSQVAMADAGLGLGRNQSFANRGADFFLGLARSIGEHLRRQREYRDLLELPDHLLEDIGVTRTQVVAAMRWRLY